MMIPTILSRHTLATAAAATPRDHYRVVIVGAGTGGLAVAHALSTSLRGERIAVVDASEQHANQPLWTFVGAGLKSFESSVRPTASLLPNGVTHVRANVAALDPVARTLTTSGTGSPTLSYDHIVLAPGIAADYTSIGGLEALLADPNARVVSNYHPEYVQKGPAAIASLARAAGRPGAREQRALFTMPASPIKCPGAPQKMAYLAEEAWRDAGVRGSVRVDYATGTPRIFAIDKYARALEKVAASRGVNVTTHVDLVRVTDSAATFKVCPAAPGATSPPAAGTPGTEITLEYDFLHVSPPHRPPAFIRAAGLADAAGFVAVDRHSLQHVKYPTVFALGDAAGVPTSKTAAAAAAQTPVLVTNLLASLSGKPATVASYDGYASCPLITGKKSVILAEFSGFTGQPMETFGAMSDQGVERGWAYTLTADVLPWVYWNGLVKQGWWQGPKGVRETVTDVAKAVGLGGASSGPSSASP
ncbi:hypothetical protein BC828DRAFT_372595 [Blastocladiella britannica]|nr:hypothetical protein BC828DRAFT_372595 [Blastocladiella britannica]